MKETRKIYVKICNLDGDVTQLEEVKVAFARIKIFYFYFGEPE